MLSHTCIHTHTHTHLLSTHICVDKCTRVHTRTLPYPQAADAAKDTAKKVRQEVGQMSADVKDKAAKAAKQTAVTIKHEVQRDSVLVQREAGELAHKGANAAGRILHTTIESAPKIDLGMTLGKRHVDFSLNTAILFAVVLGCAVLRWVVLRVQRIMNTVASRRPKFRRLKYEERCREVLHCV